MDTIFKVELDNIAQAEEFYKAVVNTDDVEIVTKYEVAYRIQGDEEAFERLSDTLKEQQQEEAEYEQYEYAKANQKARSNFRSALNNER